MSARVAYCKAKNCNYNKDYPPKSSTSNLAAHLKHNHKELYDELMKAEAEKEKNKKQQSNKRDFFPPGDVGVGSGTIGFLVNNF